MKQKWLLTGIIIILACNLTFLGYEFWKNWVSKYRQQIVYVDTFVGVPIPEAIKSCEQGGILCGMLYWERAYYQHRNLFSADFPEKPTLEKYLTLGCEANSLQACDALGQYYLEEKEVEKAWLPLAKACFGNNRGGCLGLDQREQPPNNVLIDIKTTFDRLISINPVDAVLTQSQKQFKECYSKRDREVGMMRFEIVISNKKAQAKLLGTSLGQDLTKCMLSQIEALTFPADIQTTLVRRFEYKWENIDRSKQDRN